MYSDPVLLEFMVLIFWPLVSGIVIFFAWRNRSEGVGFVPSFLTLFTLYYWLTPFVYVLPWYEPLHDRAVIAKGFSYACLGLLSFAFAVIVVRPFLRDFHQRQTRLAHAPRGLTENPPAEATTHSQRFSIYQIIYLFVAISLYFFVQLQVAQVATVSAFVSGLTYLFFGALISLWWKAAQSSKLQDAFVPIALSGIWIIGTMLARAFVASSFSTILMVTLFALSRAERLKWRHIFLVIISIYLSLSFFTSWMRGRSDFRATLWSGTEKISLSERLGTINIIQREFQLFSLRRQEDLNAIDFRLELPYLTGLAIERIENREVEPAYGQTVADAFLMLIPRAIWSGKPLQVGGDRLVAKYTGIDYHGGTTVSTGTVMEFYVNFGSFGVILGFIGFGVLMVFIDERAARSLQSANWPRLAMWVGTGVAITHPGDELIIIVSSGVSTLLAIAIFNYALEIFFAVSQTQDLRPASDSRVTVIRHP